MGMCANRARQEAVARTSSVMQTFRPAKSTFVCLTARALLHGDAFFPVAIASDCSRPQINIVLSWFEELNERVPVP
jgi:hypothetical protein